MSKRSVNVFIVILLLVFCCGILFASKAPAADRQGGQEVISAAETVFRSMSQEDYPLIWSGLTGKSQKSIIQNVRKSLLKARYTFTDEQIREDFAQGGEIARGYWTGYLSQFDPKTVLEESRWTLGRVRKDRAEIFIRHKKSDHDAIIQMYLEEGKWKVGLEESFYTRRFFR